MRNTAPKLPEPDLVKREAADVHLRGLSVVTYNEKSWECALNYFPSVTQNCRHESWEIGPDGRVRPRRGIQVKPGAYQNEPRIKIVGRSLAASPLPPPPPPEQSIIAIMTRVEAKLDQLLLSHGVVQSAG